MKKIISVLLTVCMIVMCAVPAFAYTSYDALKGAISDQALAGAVGGCAGVISTDITSYDGFTGLVQATIKNDMSLYEGGAYMKYWLESVDPATGKHREYLIEPTAVPSEWFGQTVSISGTTSCRSGCLVKAKLVPINSPSCAAAEATSSRAPGR